MIRECLSEDKLRVMRSLLGRSLNVDLDSRMLFISLFTIFRRDEEHSRRYQAVE
jgi:hypothetical protein